MQKKAIEISVGMFMIFAIIALVFLALKVSGLADYQRGGHYTVYANFDNVGDLKVRAPVRIAGVKIGEVTGIYLDPADFRAKVKLSLIDQEKLPTDTAANIYTQGLLGSNYINLTPGYQATTLKNGDTINDTTSALILEKLIGQFLFNMNKSK